MRTTTQQARSLDRRLALVRRLRDRRSLVGTITKKISRPALYRYLAEIADAGIPVEKDDSGPGVAVRYKIPELPDVTLELSGDQYQALLLILQCVSPSKTAATVRAALVAR